MNTISVEQYATAHKVSKMTVYNWIKAKRLNLDDKGQLLEGQPRPKPKVRGAGKKPSTRKIRKKTLGTLRQLDMRFNYIKSFNSIKEASKEIGCSGSAISRACNNVTRSAFGFRWERERLQ
jgi:DNA invertase Pin-like site-specific DNA recombinase